MQENIFLTKVVISVYSWVRIYGHLIKQDAKLIRVQLTHSGSTVDSPVYDTVETDRSDKR